MKFPYHASGGSSYSGPDHVDVRTHDALSGAAALHIGFRPRSAREPPHASSAYAGRPTISELQPLGPVHCEYDVGEAEDAGARAGEGRVRRLDGVAE